MNYMPRTRLSWEKCLLHSASTVLSICFSAGQCTIPHSQVTQGLDGRQEGQDSVMASPITRPEPHWKPLECDQVKEGRLQAIKQTWASWILAPWVIKLPKSNVKDWWRECQETSTVIKHEGCFTDIHTLALLAVLCKMEYDFDFSALPNAKNTTSVLLAFSSQFPSVK